MFAGYAPMMLIGLPWGWPPVDHGTVFTWALAHQFVSLTGGILVAIFVLSASVSLVADPGFGSGVTIATLPQLLFPLWGLALGAAALGYHLRRRPACPECAEGLVEARTAGAY